MRRVFVQVVILLAVLASAAWAQGTEKERVEDILRQAQSEIQAYRRDGGKPGGEADPVRKWSAELWKCRGTFGGTEAGSLATAEAVHLLIHAEAFAEADRLAAEVPPNDSAWPRLAGVLFEAGTLRKDYTPFVAQIERVLSLTQKPDMRAELQLQLGRAFWQLGDLNRAKEVFEKVRREMPESTYAKQAEGNLYELEHLSVGKPAPVFAATTRSGAQASLADWRGRVVVLIFWAST